MGKLYIVRVYEGEAVFEYEFGNLPHAECFTESEICAWSIWLHETSTGLEYEISRSKQNI